MKAILVDDEKPATELLELKLRKLNLGVQVLAKFNLPEAAAEFIRHTEFDVLFLDVEMPRMNGFDLLEQFETYHFDVIFTTAYDQYALKAFRFSALNYLLKPIQEDELRQAIGRWQQQKIKQLQRSQLGVFQETMTKSLAPKTQLAVPTQEGHEVIDVPSLVRCVADAGYTHFHFLDGKTLLICRTLKEVEQALEPAGFVRVHLSHLINPAYLKKIVRQEGGYLLMADGAQVPVTKQKRDWLLEWMGTVERRG